MGERLSKQEIQERRRQEAEQKHALYILARDGGLEVRCNCGAQLGGHRAGDEEKVTFSCMLDLVRIHWAEINAPGRRR